MRQTSPMVAQEKMLRPLDSKGNPIGMKPSKKDTSIVFFVYVILLLLGIGTGYLLSQNGTGTSTPKGTPITSKKVVGVLDATTFKDCASGTLEKGGLDGEGTHKLVREGGPTQTAYLISSIVDLDQYTALKVKVCGQTLAAKKVTWLMDVGRLELE